MSPELSQRLALAVDEMPAFPKSVQKILELTRDVDCTPKDLVQVIDKDPVLTVKILKVVNSAYYSLPKQVTSINHAVVFMGFNTIKNLALGIAAIGMLPKSNAAGFDVQQYLLHSLATAGIARQLASDLDSADPMDCFIAGLLHDFGVEAIRNQHGAELKDSDMIACVFAANQISKKLQFGFGGNTCIEELTPAMARRLGGHLDAVIARLGDLTTLFEEAQIFSRLEG